jgi:hypothetical protein
MTEFWRKWLIATAAVIGLAGLGLAALTATGASRIHDTLFDLVSLPGELGEPAGEAASFAMGVTGAVMAGWAAMMLVVLSSRSMSGLPTTWWALTVGLLAWFVVDAVVSIAAGALGNLILNVVLFALFAPALAATRPGRA